MAQVVGYFEDHPEYEEGPFVLTNPMNNGWRIEVEGPVCPILPDVKIYDIIKKMGMVGKTRNKQEASQICDRLNQMVKEGKIIKKKGCWIPIENIPKPLIFPSLN